MATVTSELVTEFSFVGSLLPLEQFNKNMGSSIKIMAGVVAAMGAAAAATLVWADATLQAQRELTNLSERSGITLQRMNDLGFVAAATGSDMMTLTGTLDSLNAAIGDAAINGSDAFAMLGISATDINGNLREADDVLLQVGKRFQDLQLPRQVQESLAAQLGIDNTLLNFLNLTNEEFSELIEQSQAFGVITKEQQEQIADYNNSVNKLGAGWDRLKNIMAVGLAPALTTITDGFSEFIRENKDLIANGLKVTLEFLGELAKALMRIGPILLALAAPFAIFSIVTSPILLVVAGITALLLIIDDLLVGMQGGESVIFNFFESFGVDLKGITDGLGDIFEIFSGLFKLGWNTAIEGVKTFLGFIEKVIAKIPKLEEVKEFFQDDPNEGFFDRTIPDAINNFQRNVGLIDDISTGAYGARLAAQQAGGGRTINQNVTQNITTSDPLAAGDRSSSSLQSQLDNAETQVNRTTGI